MTNVLIYCFIVTLPQLEYNDLLEFFSYCIHVLLCHLKLPPHWPFSTMVRISDPELGLSQAAI